MMGQLQGKTAVITGGTRGFGFEVAKAYLMQDAKVVIASRDQSAIEYALSELNTISSHISGTTCNVTEYSDIVQLADFAIQCFGGFDIWVNNAGVSAPYGPTTKIDPNIFEIVLRTNIFGVYYGSLVAMRHFLLKRSGKLINILGYGSNKPGPMQNAYASSKAWVRNFTLALAEEHKGSGLGIYLYNPGLMETELLQKISVIDGYQEKLKPFTTVRRFWSQPPQVPAKKAVWLASSSTDMRSGLEINETTTIKILSGLIKNLLRRFTDKRPPDITMELSMIPPFTHTEDSN